FARGAGLPPVPGRRLGPAARPRRPAGPAPAGAARPAARLPGHPVISVPAPSVSEGPSLTLGAPSPTAGLPPLDGRGNLRSGPLPPPHSISVKVCLWLLAPSGLVL